MSAPLPKAFAVPFADLERWDYTFFRQIRWGWPDAVMRRLGNLMTRRQIAVDVDEERLADIPIIEKVSFGGRLSVRPVEARLGYKGRLFWAESGWLVWSKIRAKQGSIALVPATVERVAVSAEYPVYEIDAAVVDPRYVHLLTRAGFFSRMLDGVAHGGSTKTRITPEAFEALRVPVPPLDVQRAIVAHADRAEAEAAALLADADRSERRSRNALLVRLGLPSLGERTAPKAWAVEWEALERWSGTTTYSGLRVGGTLRAGHFPLVSGHDLLESVRNGCSASPSPFPTGLDVLKISAVTRGHLRPEERKYVPDVERYREDFSILAGDVLMCRTNGTLGYVGRPALVEEDLEDVIFPDKVIRVRVKRDRVLPAYLWQALELPHVRAQIEAAARTAVGNYAIGGPDVWALEIPLPPLDVQAQIVADVQAVRARAAALRAEARTRRRAAAAETEAMLLGTAPAPAAA